MPASSTASWNAQPKSKRLKWDERFRQIVAYRESEGNCNVPKKYEGVDGLGKWVDNQRQEYRKYLARKKGAAEGKDEKDLPKSSMTEDHIRRLDEIDFNWGGNEEREKRHNQAWEKRYHQIVTYRESEGNCNVPKKYKAVDGLGKWVDNQRQEYRKYLARKKGVAEGKDEKDLPKSSMTEDHIRRLDEIDFNWGGSEEQEKGYDQAWEKRFNEILRYKSINGDCLVPHGYKKNKELAEWVHRQREEYKAYEQGKKCVAEKSGRRDNSLVLEERFRRLSEIGFVWELIKKAKSSKGNAKGKGEVETDKEETIKGIADERSVGNADAVGNASAAKSARSTKKTTATLDKSTVVRSNSTMVDAATSGARVAAIRAKIDRRHRNPNRHGEKSRGEEEVSIPRRRLPKRKVANR